MEYDKYDTVQITITISGINPRKIEIRGFICYTYRSLIIPVKGKLFSVMIPNKHEIALCRMVLFEKYIMDESKILIRRKPRRMNQHYVNTHL